MATPFGFDSLAECLEHRLEEVTADALERVGIVVPEFPLDRPAIGEVFRVGTRGGIAAELGAFRQGGEVPDELPEIYAEGARLTARSGIPLDLYLALYRVNHAVIWQAWFDLVENDGQLALDRRRALLDYGSAFFFTYADRLSRLAAREYQAERDRLHRGAEERRVHQVRELLRGADDAADSSALGYSLDDFHIAVIASGGSSRLVLGRLADQLGRQLLAVEIFQQTWWGWLGGRQPAGPRLSVALAAVGSQDVRLGVGDDRSGLSGFRDSHDEAAQAHEIGQGRDASVTLFEDVALEALALRDAQAARRFAERELRGIEGSDERAVRLRTTLEAYFAHGQNAASTAAALGVHEQTIAKRLRTIEARLGRTVPHRRAELELALRLSANTGPGPAS